MKTIAFVLVLFVLPAITAAQEPTASPAAAPQAAASPAVAPQPAVSPAPGAPADGAPGARRPGQRRFRRPGQEGEVGERQPFRRGLPASPRAVVQVNQTQVEVLSVDVAGGTLTYRDVEGESQTWRMEPALLAKDPLLTPGNRVTITWQSDKTGMPIPVILGVAKYTPPTPRPRPSMVPRAEGSPGAPGVTRRRPQGDQGDEAGERGGRRGNWPERVRRPGRPGAQPAAPVPSPTPEASPSPGSF